MSHQSQEDAEAWEAMLTEPVPGQRDDGRAELDQLKQLL